ncbi:MAG: DUF7144 family membrane protein [Solirubrobacterales bacterium]
MNTTKESSVNKWITFAGVMLLIGGTLNVIEAIAMLADDNRFDAAELLFANLTAWGIVHLIVGGLQYLAAGLLFQRRAGGVVLAITIASISGIAHFMTIGVYPLWSVTVMAINFAIIFGLLSNDDAFG